MKLKLNPGEDIGLIFNTSDPMPPEKISNSLGTNGYVLPEKIRQFSENITGERVDSWCVYLPDAYDGTKKMPLIMALHGGKDGGLYYAKTTSWALVAEREGLIVCYPDHPKDCEWLELDNGISRNGADDYGLRFLRKLVDVMCDRYAVDTGKIFMNGMSAGCVTTLEFSKWYGDVLAGCAEDSGPSIYQAIYNEDGTPKDFVCPLPAYFFHGEFDGIPAAKNNGITRQDVNRYNRELYMMMSECEDKPLISIEGDNNLAYYKGKKGDVMYRSMVERHHGQPFDNAEFIWRYLFSGMRKAEDGTIIKETPLEIFRGDETAVVLHTDRKKAYFKNEIVNLKNPVREYEEKVFSFFEKEPVAIVNYIYAAAEDIADLFGLSLTEEEGGKVVYLSTKEGTAIQAAAANAPCIVNDRICSFPRQAEYVDGKLYLPVRWFAEHVLDLSVTERNGAIYMSKQSGRMSLDMEILINSMLS